MLRLYTLGRLELARGDPPALEPIAAQTKRLALLAYLAVAAPRGGSLRRDTLLALLWPELGPDEARRALRQALHHLRNLLGDNVVVGRADETVSVAADRLWCDAVALDEAVDAGRPAEALALYRPFLDGVYLPDVAPEYEQWVETTRDRLRRRTAAAAWMVADEAERAGHRVEAAVAARRAVELAPDEEPAVRRLMELLARLGDQAGALRAYQELERRLAAEYDARPSTETQALATRLRTPATTLRAVTTPAPADHTAVAAATTGATPAHGVAAATSDDLPPPSPAASHDRPTRSRPLLWMGSVAVVLLLAAAAVYAARRAPPGDDEGETLIQQGLLAPRDRILVGDFANRTRDTLLAGAITEAVRVDLAQSPAVTVLGTQQMRGALARMERPADAPVDDSTAQELAAREGAKAFVTGDVSSVGTSYLVTAQLVATSGGQLLGAFRETAPDSAALVPAIDRLSRRIRRRVGETLRLVRASPPLEQATTPSLAALRAYSQAVDALYARGDRPAAIDRLRRAVALDSGFAMAYRLLGSMYGSMAEPGRAADAMSSAYAHRDRLPFRERYLTTASYHANVTHDWAQAKRAYEALLDLYPDDVRALNNLGIIYTDQRDYAGGAQLFRRAIAADSTIPVIWAEMTRNRILAGRFADARATIDEIHHRFPSYRQIELLEAYYAAAQLDWPGAERHLRRQVATLGGDSLSTASQLASLADIAMAQGRLRAAAAIYDSSLAIAHAARSAAGAYYATIRLAEMDLVYRGASTAAVARVDRELARLPLASVPAGDRQYYELAQLYARAGRPDRARALVARAARDSTFASQHLDAAHHAAIGAIALAEGRPREAIDELRRAEASDDCTVCALPALGRAYDAAGDTANAIATYERYLRTPWLYPFEPGAANLAPSLTRLAQLYEHTGQREKAATTRAALAKLLAGADDEVKRRPNRRAAPSPDRAAPPAAPARRWRRARRRR